MSISAGAIVGQNVHIHSGHIHDVHLHFIKNNK